MKNAKNLVLYILSAGLLIGSLFYWSHSSFIFQIKRPFTINITIGQP